MIVMLDSTALVADPLLRSTAWKVLAHAARSQGVRVCITEVVRRETIAGHGRRIAVAVKSLDSWDEKFAGALGLTGASSPLREVLAERIAAYEDELAAALAAAGVEIVPVPQVDHEVLIDRAVRRVPPCDTKGNGYRDTLNWLALCALLEANESEDVVWVSADSGDFADVDGITLHPDLLAELGDAGAAERFTFATNMKDAAFHVAATYTEGGDDLAAIQRRLVAAELAKFVSDHLLTDPGQISIDSEHLALPIVATGPVIGYLEPVGSATVEVKASLDAEETAVQVTVPCAATVLFAAPALAEFGEGFTLISDDGQWAYWETVKVLNVQALVSVDSLDKPTGGEVTGIQAPVGDPGHAAWASRRRRAEPTWSTEEARAALRAALYGYQPEATDWRDKLLGAQNLGSGLRHALSGLDQDRFANLGEGFAANAFNNPEFTTSVRSAFLDGLPVVGQGFMEGLRAVGDPAFLRGLQAVSDPEILRGLRAAGAALPSPDEHQSGPSEVEESSQSSDERREDDGPESPATDA